MIPIKCYTCGSVLADKYRYYVEKVEEVKSLNETTYAISGKIEKTIEGRCLDNLNLKNICCRRHILTHVEIN